MARFLPHNVRFILLKILLSGELFFPFRIVKKLTLWGIFYPALWGISSFKESFIVGNYENFALILRIIPHNAGFDYNSP